MIQAISMTIATVLICGPIALAGFWMAKRSARALATDPFVICALIAVEKVRSRLHG